MNKKGFTLIELLAVVAIIGLLAGLVSFNVLKVYERQKGKINKQEQKLLVKGATEIISILEDCDASLEQDREILSAFGLADCNAAHNMLGNPEGFTITIDQLKETGFIEGGNLSSYSGSSEVVVRNDDGQYVVDASDIHQVDTSNSGLLASAIKANARSGKNGTTYTDTPSSTPAVDVTPQNRGELSKTKDEKGDSYYFRGDVKDNYVNFAGMCWRIVRIEGDGSIKLILEDKDKTCKTSTGNWNILTGNFGYDNNKYSGKSIASYINPVTNESSSQATAFKNFETSKLSSYKSKLKITDWCYDDTAYSKNDGKGGLLTESDKNNNYASGKVFFYDSYVRLYNNNTKSPTLKCNGKKINNLYVAALTADEVAFAGGVYRSATSTTYLRNGKTVNFWTMSPDAFSSSGVDRAFIVSYNGHLANSNVNSSNGIRPAIQLANGTTISGGVGIKGDPYIVE